MTHINEMELQNLRHLLLSNANEAEKYTAYAEQAQDSSVKQFFQQSVQSATDNKNQLLEFLK